MGDLDLSGMFENRRKATMGGGPYRTADKDARIRELEKSRESLMDRVVELESMPGVGVLRVHDITNFGVITLLAMGFVAGAVVGFFAALRMWL